MALSTCLICCTKRFKSILPVSYVSRVERTLIDLFISCPRTRHVLGLPRRSRRDRGRGRGRGLWLISESFDVSVDLPLALLEKSLDAARPSRRHRIWTKSQRRKVKCAVPPNREPLSFEPKRRSFSVTERKRGRRQHLITSAS